MIKAALAGICVVTLAATVYLTISLLTLAPPAANDPLWAVNAAVIIGVGVATLAALAFGPTPSVRYLSVVAAAIVAVVGISALYRTLSGPHFEGYALVLGAMLLVQAALTLVHAARPASHVTN